MIEGRRSELHEHDGLPGEAVAHDMTSHDLRAGDDDLSRALRSGADAVFVGRIGDGRTIVG